MASTASAGMSILSQAVTALENENGQVAVEGEQPLVKQEMAEMTSEGATTVMADGKEIQVNIIFNYLCVD